jgi:hypothetical protein
MKISVLRIDQYSNLFKINKIISSLFNNLIFIGLTIKTYI